MFCFAHHSYQGCLQVLGQVLGIKQAAVLGLTLAFLLAGP
jgi:hypothetical protein